MARYTGAVCRQCRREGQKLFLKGERCYSDKCAFARRSFVPGQHGAGQVRKKVSEYGLQLRAKQKAKRYYGVLESQFAHYFDMAERKSGMTGENLLRILESRLDSKMRHRGDIGGVHKVGRQFGKIGGFRMKLEIFGIGVIGNIEFGDAVGIGSHKCFGIRLPRCQHGKNGFEFAQGNHDQSHFPILDVQRYRNWHKTVRHKFA